MAARLKITENGYVLHLTLEDPWAVPELLPLLDTAKSHLDAATHPVHTLVIAAKARQVPFNLLSSVQHASYIEHPNHGFAVVVGTDPFTRRIAEAFFLVYHFERVYYVG